MPTNKYNFKTACVCVWLPVCELFTLHSEYRHPFTLVHSEWKQQTIISFNVILFSFYQIDFNRFVRFYTFVFTRCKVRLCYLACVCVCYSCRQNVLMCCSIDRRISTFTIKKFKQIHWKQQSKFRSFLFPVTTATINQKHIWVKMLIY